MSKQTNHLIDCPKCGAGQTVSLWRSINVDLDPDLRKELFDGEINLFECEKCGYKAYIPISLMYHDMGREFAVQYYPRESLDDPTFIAMFEPENPPRIKDFPKEMGYIAQPHIVFSLSDLLACVVFHEKIRTKELPKVDL